MQIGNLLNTFCIPFCKLKFIAITEKVNIQQQTKRVCHYKLRKQEIPWKRLYQSNMKVKLKIKTLITSIL